MAPPDCVHVETTQHTIEERVKMPTVNEPFELCVLPPFDVTRDTVRIMFANCAMLHGTIQRCDDKFVVLATDNSKCNDKSWMIFTKNILTNILTKDVLRMTHLFLMALKSQFKGKLLLTRALPVVQALLHAETTENISNVFQFVVDIWAKTLRHRAPLPDVVTQMHQRLQRSH